jgi:hypothetical protein
LRAPGQPDGNGPRALISTAPESTGKRGRELKGRTGGLIARRNAEGIGRER